MAFGLGLAVIAAGSPNLPAPATTTRADLVDAETFMGQFDAEVVARLALPQADQAHYIELLQSALRDAGVTTEAPQHLVLVDRSPQVQMIALLWFDPAQRWRWIGASPVSTGRPGSFDHFLTPTGVFAHTPDNPDFRAEGTFNENHIRGYGQRDMRVFDFGWVRGERGWGGGGLGTMRLQMHATDPDVLERRLGTAQSKGCIRIHASLNRYLDRHAILDADYLQAQAQGKNQWVLRADREPTPWPGRYLVVVDSQAPRRPAWSPVVRLAEPSVAFISTESVVGTAC